MYLSSGLSHIYPVPTAAVPGNRRDLNWNGHAAGWGELEEDQAILINQLPPKVIHFQREVVAREFPSFPLSTRGWNHFTVSKNRGNSHKKCARAHSIFLLVLVWGPWIRRSIASVIFGCSPSKKCDVQKIRCYGATVRGLDCPNILRTRPAKRFRFASMVCSFFFGLPSCQNFKIVFSNSVFF